MAIQKNELHISLWASFDKLRGGMDAPQCYAGKTGYYANACVRRESDGGNFTMQFRGSAQGKLHSKGNAVPLKTQLIKECTFKQENEFEGALFYRSLYGSPALFLPEGAI